MYAGVSITLAPDGKTIAFTSQEQTIYVRDTATGKELRQLQWPGLNPRGIGPTIVLGPDGKTLAAWSNDFKLRLWDISTGKERWQKQTLFAQVIARMAISPNGKMLALGYGDRSVRLWETATGKELHKLDGHQFGAYGLTFSADSKTLATGGMKQVRTWDVTTGQQRYQFGNFKRPVFALAFSADGKTLSAATDGGECAAWDVSSGKELRQFNVLAQKANSGNPISKIAFAENGKILAWTAWNNRIQLTDVQTGQELLAGSGQPDANHFALAPDGKTLASLCTDGKLRLWNTTNGKEVRAWTGIDGPLSFLHFTPDGKTLITLGAKLQRWNAATGEEQAKFDTAQGPFAFGPSAVLPDAKVLAVGAMNLRGGIGRIDCKITFWDLTTGKKLAESAPSHKDSVLAVAFSPNGKWLISAGGDRTLRLWQTTNGVEIDRVENLTTNITRLAFGADGRTVFGACSFFSNQGKQELRILAWEVGTWKERKVREGPAGPVFLRTFSDDAKWMAWTDASGTVHVETVADGKEIGQFRGQQGEVFTVQFTQNRRQLATGSRDGTILIWDLAGKKN
jgi:WD40 repeat protein